MAEMKPATTFTSQTNQAAVAKYAMDDRQDFADADRGLITPLPDKLLNDKGEVIRDGAMLAYITDDALPGHGEPEPVAAVPTGQAGRAVRGRRRPVPGAVRGANITIVDAPDGLVIIDTGTSVDLAKAGMELFRREMGNDKPVVAVIYTHTHFDHYAGVKGVVDEADVASGKVPIIAPGTIASFDKFAIGENVITGNAMSRRMGYTFGLLLPHCDCGLVTVGLGAGDDGMNIKISYISPTDPITQTGEIRTLGGWDFEFLYAPDTEAPEEMHIWIPEIKALTCAENANHTMHNIQTIRGARTRDARNFARYLDETLVRWGDEAEVHYGPHTWPVWGNDNVVDFLENPSATCTSTSTTSRCAWPTRASRRWRPPRSSSCPTRLGRKWYNRYYHGGLHHNVRAVFHKELGFWDGDPATILPLLPEDNAQRHVELIGRDKILAEGRTAIDAGDYRWAVQVLHHLVFADPDDTEARNLQADAYEQLGYQQEVPQYRGDLPDRGQGAARRRRNRGPDQHRQPGHHPGHADRPAVRLRRRAPRSVSGPPTSTCASTSPSPTPAATGRCGSATASSTPAPGHVDGAQLTVAGPESRARRVTPATCPRRRSHRQGRAERPTATSPCSTRSRGHGHLRSPFQPVHTLTVPGRRRRAPGARAGRVDGPLRPASRSALQRALARISSRPARSGCRRDRRASEPGQDPRAAGDRRVSPAACQSIGSLVEVGLAEHHRRSTRPLGFAEDLQSVPVHRMPLDQPLHRPGVRSAPEERRVPTLGAAGIADGALGEHVGDHWSSSVALARGTRGYGEGDTPSTAAAVGPAVGSSWTGRHRTRRPGHLPQLPCRCRRSAARRREALRAALRTGIALGGMGDVELVDV